MTATIRPMKPTDVDAVDRLWKTGAVPWPGASVALEFAASTPSVLLVADDDIDGVVGYASLYDAPILQGRYASMRLRLRDDRRGRGLGRALGMALHPHLERSAVGRFMAQVDADDAASRETASRHGWAEVGEHIVSVLDLSSLPDPPPEPPEATLSVHQPNLLDEAQRDRLYRFLLDRAQDAPDVGAGNVLMPRPLFDTVFRNAWQILMLRDGDRDVALTVAFDEEEGSHTVFTGTTPDWRGRGLAEWLKRMHAAVMRDRGRAWLRTENMTSNPTILAVNARIGFQRTSAFVDVVLDCS